MAKTMTYTISQSNIADIIADIKSYIKQTESREEREAYTEELEQVKGDIKALIHSGVFHDACGKVIGLRGCFNTYEIMVALEY